MPNKAITLALAVGVGITSAVAFYVVAGYDIEYVCRADFTYVKSDVSCNHRDGGEWERHIAVEKAGRMLEFVKSDASRRTISRALADTATTVVDEERIGRLLSSMDAEIVEMPVTNFAVVCRLTISDRSKALLQEIVSLCVRSIQKTIDDENELGIQRACYSEFQEKFKCERRIARLEQGHRGGEDDLELSRERDALRRIEAKIDETRRLAMSQGEARLEGVAIEPVTWRLVRKNAEPAGPLGVPNNERRTVR